jgi:hypothetical protein
MVFLYRDDPDLWAAPHIDDLASLFGIGIELDAGRQIATLTYRGRCAQFSTEGWVGMVVGQEHAPHEYFDFLAQEEVSTYYTGETEQAGDFEEWAASHDYAVEERRTRVLWRYYRLVTSRLQRLFGDDFDYIVHSDFNMPREEADPSFSPQLVERFEGTLRRFAPSREDLRPSDVGRVLREARRQGWGPALRHWLLACPGLLEETRRALIRAETIILTLPGDCSVRSSGDAYELGAYVRCCGPDGRELLFWGASEFAREPEQAMGAFLGILVDSSVLERYRQQGSSAFILPDAPGPGDEERVVYRLNERYVLCSGGQVYGLGAYVCFRATGSPDDEDGEVVYWDQQEWQEQPEEVLGAILACLQNPALLARHRVRKRSELL